ncbi:MAG TPA: hypothetical protein H9955_03660 [Candidatus Mediterraneibacter cottocaccae]|nr:hypothetical protein [Candidatus Mediterraneibacter cottocaccae]
MNYEKIFERATIRGVVDYLLFGIGPDADNRSYEERLDDLYVKFEKAVKKYDNRPTSELLDLSNELSSETASVYTEIGLQAGMLLMKDMLENVGREQKEEKCVSGENPVVSNANKTLLEGLYKERVEHALKDVLEKDEKYRQVNEMTKQKIKEIDKIELSQSEWKIIDRALSATNERSAEYGRVAYRQGFLDAVSLLKK